MTVTGSRIARWTIRFVVAAALYVAIATVWIKQASGWESLGLFIAALVFGAVAATAWCAAIAIGQFGVRRPYARLAAHPVLTAVLFSIFALVVLSGFLGDTPEAAWKDTRSFAALVAVCTLADAAVGFALERAALSRPAVSS